MDRDICAHRELTSRQDGARILGAPTITDHWANDLAPGEAGGEGAGGGASRKARRLAKRSLGTVIARLYCAIR